MTNNPKLTEDELNRRMRAILDNTRKWHKITREGVGIKSKWTCLCGDRGTGNTSLFWHQERTNPTYPHSDIIADKMRKRGLWEKFIWWHDNQCCISMGWGGVTITAHFLDALSSADILTTPSLFKQAIISWHELTHVWKGDRYEDR